ncbi:MAG: protein translocase subunit SecDF [Crocinitomicaceae bacterium]|nr:protein translocase subunit SecDF [Crocinitomicaceae bacterium]
MRNKGFFWFLTILLSAVCVYQLSFTWVASSVEKKAEKEAEFRVADLKKEAAKKGGVAVLPNGTSVDFSSPEAYDLAKSAYVNQILKEKAGDKVYPLLGSNFQDVKNRSMAFGLDLVGGMSVTLEISVPELVKSMARNPRDSKFRKPFESALHTHLNKGGDFIDLFAKAFKKYNGDGLIVRELAITEIEELSKNSTNSQVVSFLKSKVASSMDGVEQIMNKRINQFGVAQPNIQKDPTTNRLYIELPGVQDEATVAEKLQSTANLQFFETYEKEQIQMQLSQAIQLSMQPEIVVEEVVEADTNNVDSLGVAKVDSSKKEEVKPLTVLTKNTSGLDAYLKDGSSVSIGYTAVEDKEQVDKILRRKDIIALFPADLKFMWSANPEKVSQNSKEEKYVLYAVRVPENGKALVGGKDIKNANKGLDQASGMVTVDLSMTTEGADKWAQMTSDNVGKFVAITMDDVVYSSPRVNEAITGGNTQISGSFTIQDAEDLAGLLNGGALPAPCVIKEQTKVGPTIGSENASSGFLSFGLALAIVFAYMIFYYGKAGIIADISLLANIIFIFGTLASFGAVLTLAGIAGIVLTIGMAVDANVLIYERIREELANGVDQKGAIEAGFSKALSSIIDANVTTLLTAVVLKVFGSGPIESFATTLIIGIFTSVFAAVVISRLIIERQAEKGQVISFGTSFTQGAFKNINFDFVGKRKMFYVISGIIIALGIFSLATKGLKPSVEFSGGRTFGVKFEKPADIELIRTNLTKVFVENGHVASIEIKTKQNNYNVDITTNYKLSQENASSEVNQKLNEGLGMCKSKLGKFEVLEARSVSASVSQELISNSFITILLSLVIMFAYIWFRFGKWEYSSAAIMALGHDVIIVIAMFSIFHGILPFTMDIDQAFVAAILTVIGYSINDTVIVYDRIRENITFNKNQNDHKAQINDSLNSTLSRTINTSFTTFIVLVVIFIFGGAAIKGFIFALMVGVFVGTYSSLCIATPLLIDLDKKIKTK